MARVLIKESGEMGVTLVASRVPVGTLAFSQLNGPFVYAGTHATRT